MMDLPRKPGTPLLLSFCIVGTLTVLGLLAMGWWAGWLSGTVFAVAAALLLVPAGWLLLHPDQLERPYHVYRRMAILVGVRCLRRWLLGVLFLVVILPMRLVGTGFHGGKSTEIGGTWRSKRVGPLLGGSGLRDVVVDEYSDRGWLWGLWAWIRERGNWWMASLVPFLWLLSVTERREVDSAVSAETYTLY